MAYFQSAGFKNNSVEGSRIGCLFDASELSKRKILVFHDFDTDNGVAGL